MKKVLLILLTLLLLINFSFAASFPSPEAFIESGNKADVSNLVSDLDTGMTNGLVPILTLLLKVGYAVAVIIVIVFAIKMMIASPKEKAELKSGVFPFVLGLCLLILGTRIAVLVIQLFVDTF